VDLVSQFIQILTDIANDPLVYTIIFFFFSIAAAIILPIPVELGLILSPATPYWVLALTLGVGKAIGAGLVFKVGGAVEGPIRKWSEKWRWFKRLVDICELIVAKLGYLGFYLILSIPLMSDTVPIYIFSVFNKEGKRFNMKYFMLVNFFAGVTRAVILYVLAELFGINLFG
jgi:hypothetical protein